MERRVRSPAAGVDTSLAATTSRYRSSPTTMTCPARNDGVHGGGPGDVRGVMSNDCAQTTRCQKLPATLSTVPSTGPW